MSSRLQGKQAEYQSPETTDYLRFQRTELISVVVAAPFPSVFQGGAAAPLIDLITWSMTCSH